MSNKAASDEGALHLCSINTISTHGRVTSCESIQEHDPTMKSLQRANINAFLSALIWGLIMSFVIKVSISSLTDQRLLAILQYGGVFLYPVLVSIVVRKKSGLWLNTCFFSLVGAVASFLSLDLFSALQNQAWASMVFLPLFLL